MENKMFLIEEDFANEVLKYLAGRPYIEVHQFVAGFQNLKPAETKIELVKVQGE